MPIRKPLPEDRPRLEERLGSALSTQNHLHDLQIGDIEQLQQLETSIQAVARKLRPDAPEAEIRAARRRLAYDDLTHHLARRAELPHDPVGAPEPQRTRIHSLEEKIFDLAEELEPADPRVAIARATSTAREDFAGRIDLFEPARHPDIARRRVDAVSRRLRRLAAVPGPTPQQRIHRTLKNLRRVDRLRAESRALADSRAELPHAGNVYELEASLDALPDPRAHLDRSLERAFRHPAKARQRLHASYEQSGELPTLECFARDPAAFGRLRGRQHPVFGETRQRREALSTAGQSAQAALRAHNQRGELEDALDSAVRIQDLQAENRELTRALPEREELLTELGRHMEGLELHEVRPLLQPGQAKIVQGVRHAEQHFLEPLRQASERFVRLDAAGAAALSRPALQASAQKISTLFRGAPRHILKRLTPPQMQGALLAVATVKRAAKTMTRAASP